MALPIWWPVRSSRIGVQAMTDERADAVVGTVALKHHGDGVYESTKMPVAGGYQGRGLMR
ncbi:MAG: hypothetical protein OSA87_04625 [Woeseiaceae bacterium]|nr:hypothetical protein [Woeseiaceae bacterium]